MQLTTNETTLRMSRFDWCIFWGWFKVNQWSEDNITTSYYCRDCWRISGATNQKKNCEIACKKQPLMWCSIPCQDALFGRKGKNLSFRDPRVAYKSKVISDAFLSTTQKKKTNSSWKIPVSPTNLGWLVLNPQPIAHLLITKHSPVGARNITTSKMKFILLREM